MQDNNRQMQVVQCDGWVKVRGLVPGNADTVIQLITDGCPDVARHRIPVSSLLGQLLIGRKVGETIVFEAAHGPVRLRILDAGPSDPGDPTSLQVPDPAQPVINQLTT